MKHLILGAVLLVLGFWGLQVWWNSFSFVIRAVLPLLLLGVGLMALLSSYFRAYAHDPDEEDARDVGAEPAKDVRARVEAQADGNEVDEGVGSATGPEPQES